MGYINPVLSLPSSRELLRLPHAERSALESVLRNMREQCNVEAERSWRRSKAPMALYWKACGTYARHFAHVVSRACRWVADGLDLLAPQSLISGEWTLDGRTLSLNGKPVLLIKTMHSGKTGEGELTGEQATEVAEFLWASLDQASRALRLADAAPTRTICRRCGSDDVHLDAFAAWNEDTQDHSVISVMGRGHCCQRCGGERVLDTTAPSLEMAEDALITLQEAGCRLAVAADGQVALRGAGANLAEAQAAERVIGRFLEVVEGPVDGPLAPLMKQAA